MLRAGWTTPRGYRCARKRSEDKRGDERRNDSEPHRAVQHQPPLQLHRFLYI